MTPLPRTPVVAAMILVVLPAAIALSVLVARSADTSDVRCFWTGARLVAQGLDPYDNAIWAPAVSGTGLGPFGREREAPCPGRYGYPLTTAVLTLPLGLLPLDVAAIVWQVLLLAGVAGGVAMLARAAPLSRNGALLLGLVVVYSEPFWQNVLSAQYGGIEMLGAGLLGLASGGATVVASVLVATLKPHVLPLAVVERLRRADRRDLVMVAVAIVTVVSVSLVLRPMWPLEWASELVGNRRTMSGSSPTIWGLVTFVAGQELPSLSIAASLAAALLMLVALRGTPLDAFDRLATAVVGWLLVVPYLLTDDQIVLAVAWCAVLRRVPSAPGLLIALVVAVDVASWSLYAVRLGGGTVLNALMVPLTAAVLVVALRRHHSAATMNG